MRELPSLGGRFTRPNAINSRIAGEGEPEGGDGDFLHAVIWDGNVLRDLGQLNSGDLTRALDVNGGELSWVRSTIRRLTVTTRTRMSGMTAT
jgi:hypothetical protein